MSCHTWPAWLLFWEGKEGSLRPKGCQSRMEPGPKSLILGFILPVCLLMVLPCLHPQGLIASHMSKCARCLKGVYRSVSVPESLTGPRFL